MPFGTYKSHTDCVAKNKDKRDPDAYCATVERNIKSAGKRRFSRRGVART